MEGFWALGARGLCPCSLLVPLGGAAGSLSVRVRACVARHRASSQADRQSRPVFGELLPEDAAQSSVCAGGVSPQVDVCVSCLRSVLSLYRPQCPSVEPSDTKVCSAPRSFLLASDFQTSHHLHFQSSPQNRFY